MALNILRNVIQALCKIKNFLAWLFNLGSQIFCFWHLLRQVYKCFLSLGLFSLDLCSFESEQDKFLKDSKWICQISYLLEIFLSSSPYMGFFPEDESVAPILFIQMGVGGEKGICQTMKFQFFVLLFLTHFCLL